MPLLNTRRARAHEREATLAELLDTVDRITSEAGLEGASAYTTDLLVPLPLIQRLHDLAHRVRVDPEALCADIPDQGLPVSFYRADAMGVPLDSTRRTGRALLVRQDSPQNTRRPGPCYVIRLREGRMVATPWDTPDTGAAYRFGGHFIYTGDTRFPADEPIPVYDRNDS